MRTVIAQTTGGLQTGIVRSEWLQALFGPFPRTSLSDFSGYLNWFLLECKPHQFKQRPDLVVETREHVLVHQDLAPRNMIVDDSGVLWMLDWGHAVFYPAYMEYAGLEMTAMPWVRERTWKAWWARLRWSFFRWIAAGFRRPHQKGLLGLYVVHDRSGGFGVANVKSSYMDAPPKFKTAKLHS